MKRLALALVALGCLSHVVSARQCTPNSTIVCYTTCDSNPVFFLHLGVDTDSDCVPDFATPPQIGANWIFSVGLQPGHQAAGYILGVPWLPCGSPLPGIFGGSRLLVLGGHANILITLPGCVSIPNDVTLVGTLFRAQGMSLRVVPGPLQIRLSPGLDFVMQP